MTKLRYIFFLALLIISAVAQAQDIMGKTEAIRQLMENNFNVIISEKSLEVAQNNTSIYNSGYLPTLTGNAGITRNVDDLKVEFQDGRENELKGAQSDSRTAALNLNYVIFNGFNRKYNMASNREQLNRAQLNLRQTMETALVNLFQAYYEVGRLQQNIGSLEQTLSISKERLTRAQYGFDYGRNSRLDVSNAQVDVNTDSINYLNAMQSLENAKRNLNFVLGIREANANFLVETDLAFSDLDSKETMRSITMENNVQVLIAQSNIAINQYGTKAIGSGYLPTLSANTSYSYRKGNNNSASFTASNQSSGLSYGLSLGWNIFDGGSTKTAQQNARVNEEISNYTLEQLTLQTEVNFDNAWADYQNKLFIVQAQQSNLDTNELNFERTSEQYKLGQVTSIDFRTAQNNLLNAQISLIEAQYDAKLAELLIYQLAGLIQDADF